jgi:hypothetical protein
MIKMIEEIRLGARPTDLFKKIVDCNNVVDIHAIFDIMMNECPNTDMVMYHIILKWKFPGAKYGASDRIIDQSVIEQLRIDGYMS